MPHAIANTHPRILIVAVNWLGDCVMLASSIAGLKQKHPQAYIAVLAPARVAPFFDALTTVDESIVFDERGEHKKIFAAIRVVCTIRAKKFDTVFLVHRSFTKAFVCWCAGITRRIGFSRAKTRLLLSESAAMPDTRVCHRQDCYAALFAHAGIPRHNAVLQFSLPPHSMEYWRNLLRAGFTGTIIALHLTANWPAKRWPLSHWAEFITMLEKTNRYRIVFIGGIPDTTHETAMTTILKNSDFNFCGTTDLVNLMSLLASCDICLSADSGPAHLAAALNIDTLILFGPTSEKLTAPRMPCVATLRAETTCAIPCYATTCKNNTCMQRITPLQIFEAVQRIAHAKT